MKLTVFVSQCLNPLFLSQESGDFYSSGFVNLAEVAGRRGLSPRPVSDLPWNPDDVARPTVKGLYGNLPRRLTEPSGAPQTRLSGLFQAGTRVFLASGRTEPFSRRSYDCSHFRLLVADGSGAAGGKGWRWGGTAALRARKPAGERGCWMDYNIKRETPRNVTFVLNTSVKKIIRF
ncbi:uncharacterized protein LOC144306454 [Canis aureus]